MPLGKHYWQRVNERLRDDPRFRRRAFEAVEVLDDNPMIFVGVEGHAMAEIPFTDIYCQKHAHFERFEERVMTALRWQDILLGNIIYRCVQVREAPHADADVDANRALVQDMVRHYREAGVYDMVGADFWGGKNGEDGYVEFARPFIVGFSGAPTDGVGNFGPKYRRGIPVDGRVRRFPLEIGFCKPDQMDWHLQQSAGVARLPYGTDWMVFLEAKHPERVTPSDPEHRAV